MPKSPIMEYEFVGGKRRDSKLLYTKEEQQLYVKKSNYKNKVFYNCYYDKCKARIVVCDGSCFKCGDFVEHNHSDQRAVYEELKVLNNIKRKCAESRGSGETNTLSGIRESFKSVCESNQEASKKIDFSKIQRTLQNITNTAFMTNPKTPAKVKQAFQDEAVMNNLGYTRHKGPERTAFFKECYEEKDFAYCVFASEKIIQIVEQKIPLNSKRKIIIDDTFAALPLDSFQQLLIIHIDYMDRIFPFIFVLLSKKSLKSYMHLFKFIKQKLIDLNGAVFITGTGTILRKTLRVQYPFSKAFESWFHYCQAIRQYITAHMQELAELLRKNKEVSLLYHKLLALPLLPRSHIDASFKEIQIEIENLDFNKKFKQFLLDFEIQWLKEIGPNGTSVYGTTTRTTLALDVYNKILMKSIPKHKNFFKFIQLLQNEEYNKSRDFELLVKEDVGEMIKCKNFYTTEECKEKAAKIEKFACEILKGTMTAAAFLNQLVCPENQLCTDMEPAEDCVKVLDLLKAKTDKDEMCINAEDKVELSEEYFQLDTKSLITCLVDEPNTLQLTLKHVEICSECIQKVQASFKAKKLRRYNCQACLQPLDDEI